MHITCLHEGVKFAVDPCDEYQRIVLRKRVKKLIGRFIGRPYRRDQMLSLIYDVCEKAEIPAMIDVGSNIGLVSLPTARAFPNGRIVAVEAHPVAAGGFVRNLRRNNLKNVKLFVAACSPTESLLKIHTEPTNTGGNRVTGFEARTDQPFDTVVDDIMVPSVRLDTILRNVDLPVVDCLKVDVEGYECQVLESLGEFLKPETVKTVICEYGPEGSRAAGRTGWQLVGMMKDAGYQCHELKSGKSIETETDIPDLPDFHVTDFVFTAA